MYNKINLNFYNDERGSLLPFEFSNLPFEPKRIFVVDNVPIGAVRGNHSHYKTNQFLICSKGRVTVNLDNGCSKFSFILKSGEAVLIPELVWDSQEFIDADSQIIVVCSTPYDISDYILTYSDFLTAIKN